MFFLKNSPNFYSTIFFSAFFYSLDVFSRFFKQYRIKKKYWAGDMYYSYLTACAKTYIVLVLSSYY